QADWMLDADRVRVVGDRRTGVGVRLAVRTRIFGLPAFTEPMEGVGWGPPGLAAVPARVHRRRRGHVAAGARARRDAVRLDRGRAPGRPLGRGARGPAVRADPATADA